MINEKKLLSNIPLESGESILIDFYKNFVEGLFELFCIMLDNPFENFWYECISISLGYFQLLIYIIDETVSKISLIIL